MKFDQNRDDAPLKHVRNILEYDVKQLSINHAWIDCSHIRSSIYLTCGRSRWFPPHIHTPRWSRVAR